MSIRPIDMIMMPNKSQEVSLMQHHEEQRMMQSEQFGHMLHDSQVKKESERTVETMRDENKEFRYGEKKKSGGDAKNQKKKQKKPDSEEKETRDGGIKISHFDMKV